MLATVAAGGKVPADTPRTVSIAPGATQLHVIPWGANSRDIARMSPSRPDFEADTWARLIVPEWVDTPEAIREKYQYFTEAQMGKIRGAGFIAEPTPLEDGVRRYVTQFLATSDAYR